MFCSKCGKQSKDGAAFCGGCGAKLPTPQGKQSVNMSRNPSMNAVPQNNVSIAGASNNKNRIIAIVVICIIVVAIVIAAFATNCFGLLGSNETETTEPTSVEETANEPEPEQPQAESQAPTEGSSSAAVVAQAEQAEPKEPASPLDSYSWSKLAKISREISRASDPIKVAKKYKLVNADGELDGEQTKSIVLKNGKTASVRIVGFAHDDKTKGGRAGITFIFTNSITERYMNPTDTNDGGWKNSNMRSWLNKEGIALLPDDLKKHIVTVNKYTNNTGLTHSTSSVTPTSDRLWLYSTTELVGEVSMYHPITGQRGVMANNVMEAEGNEYQLFKDMHVIQDGSNSILKNEDGIAWWTRTPRPSTTNDFNYIVGGGGELSEFAEEEEGVVPGFCI